MKTQTHTHLQNDTRDNTHAHKSQITNQQNHINTYTHVHTNKQIHTRNFAVIGESTTVSWLTGLLGLKQLKKYKRDSKCNVG